MASFFDAMVLELKLDTSQFQKGAKEIAATQRKIKDETSKSGKDIEASASKATDGINKLMLSFAGLFALLTAGKGVKQFVSDITAGDAALGRFAGTVSMSSKTIQGWQGAVESIGGSAADTASDIRMLSDQLQGLALSGDSSKLAVIGKIQALSGKRINLQANPAEQLEQYNRALHALYQKNPAAEGYLSRQLGITDADNQLLIMAPERVKKLRQEFERFAASDQDIQAAEKRQDLWAILVKQSESLGRSILTMLTPAILQAGKAIRDFMDKHGADLKKWFADVGQAILNAPWKEWLGDIKAIATDIDWAVKGTIGWKAALLGLLGVQVLNWLSPVVAAFGLLNGFLLSIVGTGPALAALFATGGALAGLAALYGLVRPTPLNGDENEIERQKRYGPNNYSGTGGGGGGGGGGEGGGDEGNKKPGENGTPWNHQTGGPPAELIKPHGDKMPSFDEFQKSLAAKPASHNDDYKGPSSANLRNKRAGIGERYDQAMRVAMDQLRHEGIPEANLHAAAAIMVGNASAESELVPQTVHDRNTGYGIYGARLDRRTGMFRWLAANGYDRNSLIGQQRYMAIEAHRRGGIGWARLRNATPENMGYSGRGSFEHAFEGPAALNNRAPQINEAYRHGVPGRASGGPVDAGSPYLVGEHGPELLIPAKSGHIFSHDDMAELWAAGRAKSRMNLLKGIHHNAKNTTAASIYNAYLQWRRAAAEHRKALKEKRELESWKRQGEANTGGTSRDHGYGFNSPSGTLGKFSHDKGIIPRHTWQRHFLPDRGVTPDANHWWNIGKHLQSASLGAGHHYGPVNSNNSNAHEVHVGAVHVNMPPGSDASAIARDIKPALERVNYSMHSNYALA